MDISEQYVKLCEKAKKIQGQKPEGSQGEFVYCGGEAYQEMDDRPLTPFVWLPMQDQLQEMVWHKLMTPILAISRINDFIFQEWAKWQWKSMEQLWLAFVMKELYGKVWSGEEWLTRRSTCGK